MAKAGVARVGISNEAAADASEGRALGSASVARERSVAAFACLLTLAVVGGFFLLPYVTYHFRYPVGWDAAFYVWRANAVTFDGLARLGTVRAGSPLLLAVLMRATGQNAFTLVVIAPPVLAGIVALGAAAVVRSALGAKAMWVPVIGLLTWAAFGRVGMMDGHLDNVLNAALVMTALAAATSAFAGDRGALAVTISFMAAGLAEWPFYVFAIGVFALALLLTAWPALIDRRTGRREPAGAVRSLAWAAGASAAFTALTFLSIPRIGGVGVGLARAALRQLLRQRFLARLGDSIRYLAFPFALAGAVVAVRMPLAPRLRAARRFFVALMAAWVLATIAAGLAQLAGIPVAGARLMSYFFAAPILCGVFVWWLGRRVAARSPGWAGRLIALAAVGAIALGFSAIAYRNGLSRVPWIEPPATKEIAAAGAYVERYAPARQVVYLMSSPTGDKSTIGRWWYVVRATLPPDEVPRAHRSIGLPVAYLSRKGLPEVQDSTTLTQLSSEPVVIVIHEYNPGGFRQAEATYPGHEVAPGVIVLSGPVPSPSQQLPGAPQPQADTRPIAMVLIAALVVFLLMASGGGWAIALLPPDPVLRVALAPGLGVAAVTLVGLVWDRAGLGFGRWPALGPLVVASALGWGIGAAAILKVSRGSGGRPEGVPAGWGPGPATEG